jgi:hypothetical protein
MFRLFGASFLHIAGFDFPIRTPKIPALMTRMRFAFGFWSFAFTAGQELRA